MERALEAIIGLLPLLLIGLALSVALATWLVVRRLRRPPRRTSGWAIAKGRAADPSELDQPLSFDTWMLEPQSAPYKGLRLPVWEIAGLDEGGPTLVMTPGWGDSRLGLLLRAERLASSCSRMLLWDPPGHGEAPGLCRLGWDEHLILGDLLDRACPGAERAVLYGASMGAGCAIVLAAQRAEDERIAGVVAESPYRLPLTPAINVLRHAGMPWRVPAPLAFWWIGARIGAGPGWRGFDRADHASRMRVPLLVLHGTRDGISPLADAEAIAGAATRGRLEIIEGAGHNNLWTERPYAEASARAVQQFLAAPR